MKNKKSLGQHWLKNRAILDKIAGLAADGGAYDFSEKTGVETKSRKFHSVLRLVQVLEP